MPSPLSWGIGRAATLLKTLLQYYGKSLEALPGVAYPGFRDNHSTLNTKTGYKKKSCKTYLAVVVCDNFLYRCCTIIQSCCVNLTRWLIIFFVFVQT